VRDASADDAAACAAIYSPYVTDTAISFESAPPSVAVMAERITAAVRTHAWLVLEADGRVVGYAYGGPFSPRPAYRWACEVSVYLERDRRRTGGGRALYGALFARLAGRGFRTAMARRLARRRLDPADDHHGGGPAGRTPLTPLSL
jgi:phosphinothricin acetyltransferase